jgi:glycosyltransferase involved in cell wall biosynthesis
MNAARGSSPGGRKAHGARPSGPDARASQASAPRLSWVSPLPPTRSGVADYATELLPELARLAAVRVVRPPGWEPDDGAAWADGLRTVATTAPPRVGWTELLHIGNNPYHLWVLARLRRHGGVVVLHDTVLHHLLVEEAAESGNWERWEEEMRVAHGAAGSGVAAARRWGITGRLDPFLLPARRALLAHADAAIVHSAAAERAVRRARPKLPVRRVPLAVAALPAGERARWRRRLKASGDDLVLAHLGFLTPEKGLDAIVHALVALDELRVPFRFVMVGDGARESRFARVAAQAGLGERVVLWGYADAAQLGGLLGAADLGLVPRFPTAGETSAAALRFLAVGTPVIVSGYGQFLELPAAAAPRIAPGRHGVTDLVRWAAHFAADRDALAVARRAARDAWVSGGHAPAAAAAALRQAVLELAPGAS